MDEPVRVLSTLALKGAVSSLAGHYVAAGGTRIEADFAPTLALLDRLRAGETADVVILTRDGLEEVAREGRVTAASCVDLARSYAGLAVRRASRTRTYRPSLHFARRCWDPERSHIRGSVPAAFCLQN
jgi:molybdate transport system substrate-binding protein